MWYNWGMEKVLIKIKHYWKTLLVIVVIAAGFYGFNSFIVWRWDTYGQNDALTWVSLILAFIVAIVALWSLKLTRDSLGLTRATTRPFLNTCQFAINWLRHDGQPTLVNNFIFGFCNTGAFPADKVSVLME